MKDSTLDVLKHSNRKEEGGLHRTIVLRSHIPPPTSLVTQTVSMPTILYYFYYIYVQWTIKMIIIISIPYYCFLKVHFTVLVRFNYFFYFNVKS